MSETNKEIAVGAVVEVTADRPPEAHGVRLGARGVVSRVDSTRVFSTWVNPDGTCYATYISTGHVRILIPSYNIFIAKIALLERALDIFFRGYQLTDDATVYETVTKALEVANRSPLSLLEQFETLKEDNKTLNERCAKFEDVIRAKDEAIRVLIEYPPKFYDRSRKKCVYCKTHSTLAIEHKDSCLWKMAQATAGRALKSTS